MINLKSIIDLIEHSDVPCIYVVFRNNILIPKYEYEAFKDYQVESLNIIDKSTMLIRLV